MNLASYNQLFSELARRHKRIAATPANGRFLRVFISADFVQKQLDLQQFYDSLRDGLRVEPGQPFLVAENYQLDYRDNDGDYLSRELRAAYLVLAQAPLGDYDGRDQVVADCEAIAEQLLAALVHQLREEHAVDVSVAEAWAEHVGPIAGEFVGVRMNLSWLEPATPELTYEPTLFLD